MSVGTCRTLRVLMMTGEAKDYRIHRGGMWTYNKRDGVELLIIRPTPGVTGGVRHSGRWEIPLINVAHIELLPGELCV